MPTVVEVTVGPGGAYHYSSLTAAEAGEDDNGDLVSRDVQLDIACFAFDDASANCNFSGWTTDATRYVRVYCPPGEGHSGVWNTSKYRKRSTTGFGAVITISEEFVRIDGIQCYQPSGSYTALVRVDISTNTSDIRIDRCLLNARGATLSLAALHMSTGNLRVLNSAVYGSSSDGIEIVSSVAGSVVALDNVTSVGNGTYGVANGSGNAACTLRNCYSGGNSTEAYLTSSTMTFTTCMHSSATSFTGSTGSIAYDTSNFTNVTSGSEDLSLPSGSDLIDAGTDLSGTFTDSIGGVTRPSGAAFDVGAFEFDAGGGGTANPWYYYAQA